METKDLSIWTVQETNIEEGEGKRRKRVKGQGEWCGDRSKRGAEVKRRGRTVLLTIMKILNTTTSPNTGLKDESKDSFKDIFIANDRFYKYQVCASYANLSKNPPKKWVCLHRQIPQSKCDQAWPSRWPFLFVALASALCVRIHRPFFLNFTAS